MSFILLGILNSQAEGGASGSYWMQLVQHNVGGTDRAFSVATDSAGDYYFSGQTRESGFDQIAAVMKTDVDGNIYWMKEFGDASNGQNASKIRINANDEVYFCGTDQLSGQSDRALLVKLNTDGVIQWQTALAISGNQQRFDSMDVSGTSYIYVGGIGVGLGYGSFDIGIAKYDTSGTLVWQKRNGHSGIDAAPGLVVQQTLDRANILGQLGVTAYQLECNSSGGINSQVSIVPDNATGPPFAEGAWTPLHGQYGHLMAVGYANNGPGGGRLGYYYVTSSVGIQPQYYNHLGAAATNTYFSAAAVDANGDWYVVGNTDYDTTGTQDGIIVKVNGTTETVEWQRRIGASGVTMNPTGITINANGDLVISSYLTGVGSGSWWYNLVLPPDGSLTGTYTLNGVDFIYEAGNLTEYAYTINQSAASNNQSNSSRTVQTPSLALASPTPTSYLTAL